MTARKRATARPREEGCGRCTELERKRQEWEDIAARWADTHARETEAMQRRIAEKDKENERLRAEVRKLRGSLGREASPTMGEVVTAYRELPSMKEEAKWAALAGQFGCSVKTIRNRLEKFHDTLRLQTTPKKKDSLAT
jgi:hypothetical protein